MSRLEEMYHHLRKTPSDINLHLDTLMELVDNFPGMEGPVVVEMGTRHGWSTVALLMGHPAKLVSYDIDPKPKDYQTIREAWEEHTSRDDGLEFRNESTLTCTIEECDILFIDTLHTGAQLGQELDRHHRKVSRYIAMHDLVSFGLTDEAEARKWDKDYYPGLIPAVFDFLSVHKEWGVNFFDPRNNGLLILERRAE